MSELTVTINRRDYLVGCDDGQEEQLHKLARYVDMKVAELTSTLGQIGDARLLVMASLMIADELSDAYRQVEALDTGETAPRPPSAKESSAEQSVAATLEACAQRIEDIATRLERA